MSSGARYSAAMYTYSKVWTNPEFVPVTSTFAAEPGGTCAVAAAARRDRRVR